MTTLFISDLHLDGTRPEITAQFLDFLDREARRAEALYILGDLFEAWIGDDDPDPDNRRVIQGLRSVTDAGVKTFLIHGNRDFLIGKRFCRETGVELLNDGTVVDLVWTARTADARRPALHRRSCISAPAAHRAQPDRPVRACVGSRCDSARSSRNACARAARSTSPRWMSLRLRSWTSIRMKCAARSQRYGVDCIIHGHTHRPAVHEMQIDGKPAVRIVLGDWYEQGSVLRWDERGFELAQLSRL